MGKGGARGRHQRNSSDELRVADLEELYEDVYEQQRGSGKRDSGRSLVARRSVDSGPPIADGVVVGSAVVQRMLDGAGPEGVAALVAEFRSALDGA